MRPALKAGLVPVWRDRDTLQIGIDPRRAIALTGMAGAAGLIGLLDGSRDRPQLIEAASGFGVPARTVDRVLSLLAAGGALDDFAAGTWRALGQPQRSSLAAELATVSLARSDSDGGARSLARRRAAQVTIHGTGRIATTIAGILSAAGVGSARTASWPDQPPPGRPPAQPSPPQASRGQPSRAQPPPGLASPAQASPAQASRAPASRAAPPAPASPAPASRAQPPPAQASAGRPGQGRPLADLDIIAGDCGPRLLSALRAARAPHLRAAAGEAIGVVGPFVLPGRTSCLRCLDHTRADADPAWPLILAQLASRPVSSLACDAPLSAAVAAQAAFQALAFIDAGAAPAAVTNGTLELVLPAWQWRRRSWPPHPACDCGSHRPP